MKNNLLIALTFIFSYGIANAQFGCSDAMSLASYNVSHSKKAFKSDNIEHTKEWVARAEETFREIEEMTSECGCEDVADFAYDGYTAADKSQNQDTWEWSHFYAKRAYEKSILLINALETCTANSFILEEYEKEDGNVVITASNDDEFLAEEHAALLEEKKIIEEKQNALAKKLEAKKLEIESRNLERKLEMEAQFTLKTNAEVAFSIIKDGYQNLAESVGCSEAFTVAKSAYELNEDQIKNSNLSENKKHYLERVNEIVEEFVYKFQECSEGF